MRRPQGRAGKSTSHDTRNLCLFEFFILGSKWIHHKNLTQIVFV